MMASIKKHGLLFLVASSVLLSCTQAGCSLISRLLPGCRGWECKTTADCQEGFYCGQYEEPGEDEPLLLCAKPGDSLTDQDVTNWINLPIYWAVFLVVVAGLGFLVYALLHHLISKLKG